MNDRAQRAPLSGVGLGLRWEFLEEVLDGPDVDLWHAAFVGLTGELKRQGADLVQAYASTPWAVEGLLRSGYISRYSVKFHIRDRQALIPRDVPFHLTPLEGDYGYT